MMLNSLDVSKKNHYHLLSTVSVCVIVEENSTGDISSIHIVDFSVFLHL